MLPVDYLILGVVVLSMLIGAYRGFFPEVLSLLSWVLGIWIAWEYSYVLEPRLAEHISSPALVLWLSRFALFAGVLIVGGLLTEIVSLAVEKARLTGANRALGLLFGLARGLVVVGVLTVFARILELPREPWWSEAKLIPFAERIAAGIEAMLPDAVIEHMPMPDATAEQPA